MTTTPRPRTHQQATFKKTLSALLRSAKWRAKRKGLPFDLDRAWLAPKLQRGVCEITGVKLKMGGTEQSARSPSIDRTHASRGYLKSNCRLVALAMNLVKGTSKDADDVREFVDCVIAAALARSP